MDEQVYTYVAVEGVKADGTVAGGNTWYATDDILGAVVRDLLAFEAFWRDMGNDEEPVTYRITIAPSSSPRRTRNGDRPLPADELMPFEPLQESNITYVAPKWAALLWNTARHLRRLPEKSPLEDVQLAERLEQAVRDASRREVRAALECGCAKANSDHPPDCPCPCHGASQDTGEREALRALDAVIARWDRDELLAAVAIIQIKAIVRAALASSSSQDREAAWKQCPSCHGHGQPQGDGSGWDDGGTYHAPACDHCGGRGELRREYRATGNLIEVREIGAWRPATPEEKRAVKGGHGLPPGDALRAPLNLVDVTTAAAPSSLSSGEQGTEEDAAAGVDWDVLSPETYARWRRERLDAKVERLRAAGWDVVARAERDKALLERDEARDERDEARDAAASSGEQEARHLPRRDDDVAAWLKQQRDCWPRDQPGWHALDDVLDVYREAADTGSPIRDYRPYNPSEAVT